MTTNYKCIVLRMMPLIAAAFMTASCGARAAADPAGDKTTEKDSMSTTTTATPDTASARVLVHTSAGDITVLLYGDTPRHRDNFLKLAREGYYDGTLFHRVIKEFMIQAGDPDSRDAVPGRQLGAGGPGYNVDAEIVFPAHFHKRGALAAARQGDQVNPMRRSSGSQFYIVTGKRVEPGQLDAVAAQLRRSRMQTVFNELAMKNRAEIIDLQQRGDFDALKAMQDSLVAQTEAIVAKDSVLMTDEMSRAYTTVGGAPHLDGQYTVFGEVVDGMDVVDRIEAAATDGRDRPKEDIRILSTEVLDD